MGNKIPSGTNKKIIIVNIKRSCSIIYCDDFKVRKFTLISFRAKDAGFYRTHTHTRSHARTMGHEWQSAALTQFAQPNYENISFWLPSGRIGNGKFFVSRTSAIKLTLLMLTNSACCVGPDMKFMRPIIGGWDPAYASGVVRMKNNCDAI